jgi:hypothetical protein
MAAKAPGSAMEINGCRKKIIPVRRAMAGKPRESGLTGDNGALKKRKQ